jgi:hypothetical protein
MDSKELEQLTKGIEGILTLYSNLGADFKDIDRLIVAKRKLCGYMYRFSVLVGDALHEYNNSYAFRKRHLADKKLEYIKQGDTIGKAELKAELLNYKFRVDEGENEALYRRVKSQYDSLRDTLSSLQQDIATLKMEMNEVRNNG